MADQPGFEAGSLSLGEPDPSLTALEQRVQRLEEKVAGLQDTAPLEERVAARVSEQLKHQESFRSEPPGPAVDAIPLETNIPGIRLSVTRPRWLLFDLFADAQDMVRMFFDFRYRPRWTTYLAVFGILPLFCLSYYWFPLAYIPVVGSILDKLLCLVLAYVLFKILSREVIRYRERTPGYRPP